jgi:hypothetical protein
LPTLRHTKLGLIPPALFDGKITALFEKKNSFTTLLLKENLKIYTTVVNRPTALED